MGKDRRLLRVSTKDNKLLKYLVYLIEVQNPDEVIDEFREVV